MDRYEQTNKTMLGFISYEENIKVCLEERIHLREIKRDLEFTLKHVRRTFDGCTQS